MDFPAIDKLGAQDLKVMAQDPRLLQSRLNGEAAKAQGARNRPVDKTGKLYQACVDFESIFVKQMLDSMRKTVDKTDGLLERSMSEDIFEDMLYDEYAKMMAQNGTFKLAETMYNQLSKYS
jgi:Rod binding domain-containing protein